MPPPAPSLRLSRRALLARLAIGVAVLACLGLLWSLATVYQERTATYRHQAERELQTISRLQASAVSDWRERRLADASALTDDDLFARAVARWREAPSAHTEAPVHDRLRILQERQRYTAVFFVSPEGAVLLPAATPNAALPAQEKKALQQALESATTAVVEPRRDPFFAFPFFSLMAPIYDGMQPLGAVWLVIDVRGSLYSLLTPWPTASKSAESALVSAEGADPVLLSPLRLQALPTPVPLVPASDRGNLLMQAVAGARGLIHARDAQGTEVLAVVNAIAESPWFLVSKIDLAEAFGDASRRELVALSLPLSLALLLAGLFLVAWQRRAWLRERTLKESLARNMQWLESAQKSALVGYYAYQPESGQFNLSPMAAELFGLPGDGPVARAQWLAQVHAEDRPRVLAALEAALGAGTPLRMQYRMSSAGNDRWVDMWGERNAPEGNASMTGTVQDITERQRAADKLDQYRLALETLVRQDPLTQVANRRALTEAVAVEWQRAARSGSSLSLLMVDVDHFKAFNDRYGHLAGDECLRKVAAAMARTAARASDLVARYGGEEFAVLLPETPERDAMAIAEQMRLAVRKLAIVHAASGVASMVTVSIGVATMHPRPHVSATPGHEPSRASAKASAERESQELFRQADDALYAAKSVGRDTVVPYTAAVSEAAPSDLTPSPPEPRST
ncbi:MAG: diguanylate cyclase [Burkholderiaceae bacterium]|nr:GGDEF domain-containing protein [Burkholderiaceae bacterium]MCO5103832.1 diguanylate cyclase [Burkholderiaceae bacterium]